MGGCSYRWLLAPGAWSASGGSAANEMTIRELSDQFELDAHADQEFVVLTLAAGIIATLGLLANSSAVVIGAMLIA